MEAIIELLNQPLNSTWVLGISIPLLIFFLWLAHRQQQPFRRTARDYASLQQLVDDFGEASIKLQAGISIEDLLTDILLDTYLDKPAALLRVYGGVLEKDNQWIRASSQVINFDYECIEDELDSYLDIFHNFVNLIPSTEPISHNICIQGQTLEYQIGHIKRTLKPKVDSDWADEAVIGQLIQDIAYNLPSNYQVRSRDDGQAVLFVVIADEQYSKLHQKTGIELAALKL